MVPHQYLDHLLKIRLRVMKPSLKLLINSKKNLNTGREAKTLATSLGPETKFQQDQLVM